MSSVHQDGFTSLKTWLSLYRLLILSDDGVRVTVFVEGTETRDTYLEFMGCEVDDLTFRFHM